MGMCDFAFADAVCFCTFSFTDKLITSSLGGADNGRAVGLAVAGGRQGKRAHGGEGRGDDAAHAW